uniref:pyocin knob domain-containing protein n=1 Tax=Hominenteromicrobium sp. TaxID=3073581 RepID=UPI003AB6AFF1
DSRGRKASTTRAINVIDYTKPGVAVCDVYRCDADGNRKKAGTYFAVEINASYSAITGNTLSITARYKKQSESSYGTAMNVTNNGKTVIGGGNIGASTTYDVLVTVADKYNSLPILRTLSTKSVLQSFKRSAGAAIGKVAELANWLDVAWDTRIRGNLQVDGIISSADQYRIKWQTIPDGADLNDDVYKVPGHYRSTQGTNKIANMPPGLRSGAFELVVTGISDGTYCTQTVKDHACNRSWVRTQTTWQTPWRWTDWANIVTTDIGGDYYARLQYPNNLIHAGNEFTFVPDGFSSNVYINYRTVGGGTGNIDGYTFLKGNKSDADAALAPIRAGNSKFTAAYAPSLGWKTLWSGKLTSGSITITGAKKYAAILVSGHPGSEAYRTHICLPTGGIDGQMVTNMVYMYFATTYSGDDCTITLKSNPSNGDINYVWGIVKWKE